MPGTSGGAAGGLALVLRIVGTAGGIALVPGAIVAAIGGVAPVPGAIVVVASGVALVPSFRTSSVRCSFARPSSNELYITSSGLYFPLLFMSSKMWKARFTLPSTQ